MAVRTFPLGAGFALCALALIGTACGVGSESPAPDADAAAGSTTAAAAPTGAGDELFDSNFSQVCRETGQPGASEYVPGPGVHPVLVLSSDDGTEYRQRTATLPEGWSAVWPDLERAELVACSRQVSATPGQVCEGYADEDSGQEWTVRIHDVVYEYTVRVARTAEVLGRTTFEVPAGSCPMFSMYMESSPQPQPYYPGAGDGETEVFLRPFVTGGEPAPSL